MDSQVTTNELKDRDNRIREPFQKNNSLDSRIRTSSIKKKKKFGIFTTVFKKNNNKDDVLTWCLHFIIIIIFNFYLFLNFFMKYTWEVFSR